MIRLAMKLALASAAVWAVWAFVPVHGRSMAERWRAAGNLATFLDRGWAELSSALPGSRPSPKPLARSQKAPARGRPSEGHTEADRQAIDRILSEHLSE